MAGRPVCLLVSYLQGRMSYSDRGSEMPELWPEGTEWDDGNLGHATAHGISAAEIDQVIANGPVYRRNKRGRSEGH